MSVCAEENILAGAPQTRETTKYALEFVLIKYAHIVLINLHNRWKKTQWLYIMLFILFY